VPVPRRKLTDAPDQARSLEQFHAAAHRGLVRGRPAAQGAVEFVREDYVGDGREGDVPLSFIQPRCRACSSPSVPTTPRVQSTLHGLTLIEASVTNAAQLSAAGEEWLSLDGLGGFG
jgi:hypothetical protein